MNIINMHKYYKYVSFFIYKFISGNRNHIINRNLFLKNTCGTQTIKSRISKKYIEHSD